MASCLQALRAELQAWRRWGGASVASISCSCKTFSGPPARPYTTRRRYRCKQLLSAQLRFLSHDHLQT